MRMEYSPLGSRLGGENAMKVCWGELSYDSIESPLGRAIRNMSVVESPTMHHRTQIEDNLRELRKLGPTDS